MVGAMRLIDAVAQSMHESPVVEREVFGTDEPRIVAELIEGFCVQHMGAAPADCEFYVASVGCVAGLQLENGHRVVVKAHGPDKSATRLHACQSAQRLLVERGFAAPAPLLPPTPLGKGLAVVEAWLRRGAVGDGHAPEVRRALAEGFHAITRLVQPHELPAGLGGAWFTTLGARLWPKPHSPLFDFEATAAGAEWIDDLARRARAVPVTGRQVLAHFDWRVEHVLLQAGRVAAVYDWDSLHLEREPIAVGAAAHAFTARWDLDPPPAPTPSLQEMGLFVEDYERVRGRPFSAAERATLWASCTYSTAYTARCQHALDPDGTRPWGFATSRELLRESGEAMLALAD
jgi:hypothetical protein